MSEYLETNAHLRAELFEAKQQLDHDVEEGTKLYKAKEKS